MSHVFYRQQNGAPPLAVHGEGAYITDSEGKSYLDGSSGGAASTLGYGHPTVTAAIKDQLDQLAYVHNSFFTTRAAESLADRLMEHAPGKLDRAYFVSGGSEAVEACIKLARQYVLARGEPQRRHLIARRQSFHGNTLGALAVGGNAWRREPFEPLMVPGHHIAPCYAYREQRPDESPEAYGLRAADELEHKIQELGADSVLAFICEPVVGATAGALPPAPGYLGRIREICDRHKIVLIFDEVMCGMGRTGSLFACEQDQVAPDLMALGKGLAAGYQPIGAMLVSATIYDAVSQGPGFEQHGHTYVAHATACAAALAVQNVIRDEDLLVRVCERGRQLRSALEDRFADHPHVGDIRGRGLMLGLEFVANRATREPFVPASGLHKHVRAAALARGLMCYPGAGTIDGQRGHHVLLAPPYIVNPQQVDDIADRLVAAVEDVLKSPMARNWLPK